MLDGKKMRSAGCPEKLFKNSIFFVRILIKALLIKRGFNLKSNDANIFLIFLSKDDFLSCPTCILWRQLPRVSFCNSTIFFCLQSGLVSCAVTTSFHSDEKF